MVHCRYNIAPRTNAPVIRRRDDGEGSSGSGSSQPGPSSRPSGTNEAADEKTAAETEVNEGGPNAGTQGQAVILQTMRWGLVPHYSKHDDGSLKTINARSEALIEEARGMWASLKGKKRCAIVCEG